MEDVEKFADSLQQAGVCFTIVIGVPGIRAMRYWTNLSRFGKPAIEEFRRQIDHLSNKVADHRARLDRTA